MSPWPSGPARERGLRARGGAPGRVALRQGRAITAAGVIGRWLGDLLLLLGGLDRAGEPFARDLLSLTDLLLIAGVGQRAAVVFDRQAALSVFEDQHLGAAKGTRGGAGDGCARARRLDQKDWSSG